MEREVEVEVDSTTPKFSMFKMKQPRTSESSESKSSKSVSFKDESQLAEVRVISYQSVSGVLNSTLKVRRKTSKSRVCEAKEMTPRSVLKIRSSEEEFTRSKVKMQEHERLVHDSLKKIQEQGTTSIYIAKGTGELYPRILQLSEDGSELMWKRKRSLMWKKSEELEDLCSSCSQCGFYQANHSWASNCRFPQVQLSRSISLAMYFFD